MAEILRPTNFDTLNISEIGELASNAVMGQKIVNATSSQGLVATDLVVIGILGSESPEITEIQTITGEAITMRANLRFTHYRNEPITKLFGDQIKIYRALNVNNSTPADSDFVLIGTVTIDPDQQYTPFTDASGGVNYWYKKTYYSSTTSSETDLADSPAVRGGGEGHYVTTDEVRREAGLQNNRYIGDDLVFEKLIAAESEVNTSLAMGGYQLPMADVPEKIKNATRLLAAGYLLTVDYGPEFNGTNKDGEKKIAMARVILKGIEDGKEVLITSEGESVDPGHNVKFFPGDESSTTPGPIFSITDKW